MLDPLARSVKDRALRPLARALAGRVHPNALTAAALAAGVAAAVAAARGLFPLALALWLLNRTLDGLDGLVAREGGVQSDLGGYLDLLADFAVYALLPLGAALGVPTAPHLPLAALLGAFYLNAASWMYLAAVQERRARPGRAGTPGTSIPFPGGLVEGTETVILFSLFLLLPAHLAQLFLITAALVLATVLQRIFWAARHL